MKFPANAEKVSESDGEIVVSPVAGVGTGGLELMTATIAEIAKAAGYYPAVGVDVTPKGEEDMYINDLLTLGLVRFNSKRLEDPTGEHPWSFVLSERIDLEEHWFMQRPLSELTKMALARQLQKDNGWTDAYRDEMWRLKKAALLGLVGVAAAKGKGKGRGKGRGGKGGK